ncbi:uncharacterized protein N0V89_002173 [Didymosphaeria variabile]|uniref:Uncharacterized protein n=1 Tax=Didymosphaeria variabile TaxID=1932322 RepID=A0A9W8XR67_9PLEO|nr:uncharacterized protein N0V89_002173 [Didymosphaeria variabile]KAJ4357597.1 hypothetical protein N0V89_002173 [Didymosphaeria variabile]
MTAYSHSPRVHAVNPADPVHSPHHSFHSSSSSRLSVRDLTLHEYRKQQNSPAPQATPPGRTLRRKAAASGLKEVERVPLVSKTPLSAFRVPPRPLHISQSTHSLFAYQQLPPSPPHQDDLSADELVRSQSAEPSRRSTTAAKVREFKPIKRLPKPLSSGRGPLPISPAPLASMTSNQPRLSPLQTTSYPSFETSIPNDDSQPTPSSVSLSKFPRPPNFADPSLSPPIDETEPPRVNTISFASTAPATPPATPAVIHYRGASFDLVNPHSSLVLDNIVTPSREIDSSEYLPLRSSEDPLVFSEVVTSPPLPANADSTRWLRNARFTATFPLPMHLLSPDEATNIPPSPNLDLPLPPTPVAHSPGPSAFDSPVLSPETRATASPCTDRRPASDSRFSLKQLTRSLTQRFSKVPEKAHEEELQEFSESRVSLASASFEGDFPRPLERSYRAVTPRSGTLPDEPITPISPLDQVFHIMDQRSSPASVAQHRNFAQRAFSAPLSSMVPDDSSAEIGRAGDQRRDALESDFAARPYYDDLASIYPSSSIYTSESRRQSNVPRSLSRNRKSNPYHGSMSEGADALAREYKSDALLQYPSSQRTSRRVSRPLEQEMFQRSLLQGGEKTDTISKFIDQYEGNYSSNASQSLLISTPEANGHQPAPSELYKEITEAERAETTGLTSGLGQFQFEFAQPEFSSGNENPPSSVEVDRAGPVTLAPHPGVPPPIPAPLAPAFQYDEDFDSLGRSGPSEISSKSPSYGDTRQLLQFSSQPAISPKDSMQAGPLVSSEYSQPGASSTPSEALEQAEDIFANAGSQPRNGGIPAIWSKRISSHNLLRSKSDDVLDEVQDWEELESYGLTGYEDEGPADWETVGNGSPRRGVRFSVGESLADYSSSGGSHSSRDSMGFSGSFPVYEEPPLEPGTFQYRHPAPLRNHSNPFASSPPLLPVGVSMPGATLGGIETYLHSSPPTSSTVPAFYGRSPDTYGSSTPRHEFLPFTPWATPYEMSEKETQELLASGPNDEILYEVDEDDAGQDDSFESHERSSSPMQPMRITIPTGTTTDGASSNLNTRERENSFDKLTMIGPKGNLTGTPQGTGMHDAGSSVADNSSPGAILDSSPLASPTSNQDGYQIFRSAATRNTNMHSEVEFGIDSSTSSVDCEGNGCYEALERRGSVNRIVPCVHTPPDMHKRAPSQATLFPQESPFPDPPRRASRMSWGSPITPRDPRRRGSRAAVPGQTKLRQMVLASSAQTLSSSDRSINDPRFFGVEHSARPSTSNTDTPLRHCASRPTLRTVFANEHSPHLLCPERALDPEEEEARRKLSWIIFAMFCVLPPTLILYRWMGDTVIINMTKGRFSHVSSKPKRIALGAGIAVNASIVAAILLPILIAHAAGSL